MSTDALIRGAVLLSLLGLACETEVEHPTREDGTGAGNTGGETVASASASAGTGGATTAMSSSSGISLGGACGEPRCQPFAACPGHECADCIDNDGDGATDMESPHCLTPCDGSESGFSGVPATGNFDACKRDCVFDGDPGSGNDGCAWNLRCDPLSPGGAECPHDPNLVCPPQAAKCLDSCLPRTPNGCDCFGCCELPAGGGEFRLIGDIGYPGCSVSDLSDCAPCTPAADCFNPCESCEICVGTKQPPPDCAPAPCPAGSEACDLACPSSCREGSYCQSGCCVVF